jgi:signal peptidase II
MKAAGVVPLVHWRVAARTGQRTGAPRLNCDERDGRGRLPDTVHASLLAPWARRRGEPGHRVLMQRARRIVGASVAVAAAFGIDQGTKAWALSYLGSNREIDLGLGASLRLVFNPGVAFGIASTVGAPLVLGIMALTAALLVWVVIRSVRGGGQSATTSLALTAGGALGNVWDRTMRAEQGPLTGHVVDFIAVDWFAIFNVADIFTSLGLAGYVVVSAIQNRSRTHAAA